MPLSARNIFRGKVTALTEGPVNAEVEITTANGERVVAMVTDASVKALDLSIGKEAVAIVKAASILLMNGTPEYRFTARNQLPGTVAKLDRGPINTQVGIALSGGTPLAALVTNSAADEMGLAVGGAVTVLFKATHVLIGVPA